MFKAARTAPDGGTRAEGVAASAEFYRDATLAVELELPPLPPAAVGLWEVFLELHVARPAAMAPGMLSYADIDAYARLHRVRFSTWELTTLRLLDAAWMRDQAEQRKQQQGVTK